VEAHETARRWLLVTVSTAGASSSLRVHAWRKLRSLGGVYLQQSVCLLPERAETTRAVTRLADRIRHEGGQTRTLSLLLPDPDQEQDIIELFQAERSDEYAEVCSRVPAFLAEIEMERSRGRTTYAEVEESEADLDRLRVWLGRVQARDYFAAPGAEEAADAVEQCAQALAAFETEALHAEAPEPATTGLRPGETARPRLRALDGERHR